METPKNPFFPSLSHIPPSLLSHSNLNLSVRPDINAAVAVVVAVAVAAVVAFFRLKFTLQHIVAAAVKKAELME